MLIASIFASSITIVKGEETENGLLSNPIPVHLNMKEATEFSPETISDIQYIAAEEKYSSH